MANIFGTRQNNEYDGKKNINTRVYQFKNKEGFEGEGSTLQISGWDEMFALRIYPLLPYDKRTNEQIFDYEKQVSTSLTLEKATMLLYKISKDIIPAFKNNEEKNVGVDVAGTNLVVVGTKNIGGTIRPYVAIHKNCDESHKPGVSGYYEFKKCTALDDYDPKTGSVKGQCEYDAEFKLFCELLESFIKLSNFIHHVQKYNGRFTNEKIFSLLNSIADKVGVGHELKYNSYGRKTSVFDDIGQKTDISNNMPMEEIGDLNDLMNT